MRVERRGNVGSRATVVAPIGINAVAFQRINARSGAWKLRHVPCVSEHRLEGQGFAFNEVNGQDP